VKDVFHFKKVAWDCPEGSPETFSQEVITPTQLRSHLHIVIHNQAAQEETRITEHFNQSSTLLLFYRSGSHKPSTVDGFIVFTVVKDVSE
jgi:hypothetical protein